MVISKPKLPPKTGYVEVEIDGRRTYRNAVTGMFIEDELSATPQLTADEERDIMLVDLEYRLIMLELGL